MLCIDDIIYIILILLCNSYYTALNYAGKQNEALHLLEQLAENAINESRYDLLL